MKLSSLLVISMILVVQAHAANLAIVDSGVDYKHKDLAARMWTNPNSETKDVDGTVYQDDTHGWNFGDKNNQIIDYSFLNTFSPDCTKLFVVQGKILEGTATADEKTWYNGKKNDADFIKQVETFGNFIHGTHVSGISSKNAPKAKLIGVKIIPTKAPGSHLYTFANSRTHDDNPMVDMYLQMAAQQQGDLLTTAGKYVAAVNSDVANGSFGVSVAAVKPAVAGLIKQVTGKDGTDDEIEADATALVNDVLSAATGLITSAPKTLFVFAAGNDGTDNDQIPEAPGNMKADNTIAVAASFDVTSLATFSSFGAQNVEVAAPGVVITSTIPGDQYLALSGTSMAAPFVTNVAGLVKDANASLTPAQIKKVIMDTVDVKDFLQGKVKTSGIVNRDRAVQAAHNSQTMGLENAIASANHSVADVKASHLAQSMASRNVVVVPLPSLF